MRAYRPKDDVQKKSYYNDRYWVAPQLPREDVSNDAIFDADLSTLKSKFEVSEAYIQKGHLVLYIEPKDNRAVLTFLRDELDYEQLMELSAVDWLAKRGGFEIFYEMLSLNKAKRIRVKCFLQEHLAINSVQDEFRMATYSEREMWDLLGVKVNNHPFMKRIMMPDDWKGHPLQKSYPLEGDEFAQWYEVDRIFGKEAREKIGPEIRDTAIVNRYDTERFSRLGHEVPKGTDIKVEGEPDTPLGYQEEEGVFLIEKLSEEHSEVVPDSRDR